MQPKRMTFHAWTDPHRTKLIPLVPSCFQFAFRDHISKLPYPNSNPPCPAEFRVPDSPMRVKSGCLEGITEVSPNPFHPFLITWDFCKAMLQGFGVGQDSAAIYLAI